MFKIRKMKRIHLRQLSVGFQIITNDLTFLLNLHNFFPLTLWNAYLLFPNFVIHLWKGLNIFLSTSDFAIKIENELIFKLTTQKVSNEKTYTNESMRMPLRKKSWNENVQIRNQPELLKCGRNVLRKKQTIYTKWVAFMSRKSMWLNKELRIVSAYQSFGIVYVWVSMYFINTIPSRNKLPHIGAFALALMSTF